MNFKNLANTRFKKVLFGVGVVVVIMLGFSSILTTYSYIGVQAMHPIEKSLNKEASEQFIKAMEYRVYIEELHRYVNYDNILMKPLFAKMKKHFDKGKELLPKDSVEDILWWYVLYKEIYSIVQTTDKSLYIENLPKEEQEILLDTIYSMLQRLPYGNNYFDIKQMKENSFPAMSNMLSYYVCSTPGLKGKEAEDAYYLNKDNSQKSKELYKLYKDAYERYIEDSAHKDYFLHEYHSDSIEVLSFDIIRAMNLEKHDLVSKMCYEENTLNIIPHLRDLIKIEQEYGFYSRTTMFYNFASFKTINEECPNLTEELTPLINEALIIKEKHEK